MSRQDSYIGSVIRTIARLWLFLLGAALVIFMITIALSVALLSVLWSLVRGKRPMAFAVYNQFRQTSQRFRTGRWHRTSTSDGTGVSDVVDVQARELPVTSIENQPTKQT